MTQERLVLAEGFINIISGFGLGIYLLSILRNPTRSLLERRLGILLAIMGTLFITRGITYATGRSDLFSTFSLVLSSLFPMAAVLFIEGLLRRHSPLGLKIAVFLGTVHLGSWALFFNTTSTFFFISLALFQGLVVSGLALITLTRDKSDYSEVENRIINNVSLACAVALPLLVSDFRSAFGWDFMRLGALGGLVFCLSLLKISDKRDQREIFREFAHVILTDLLGTLLFCFIWSDFTYFWIAYVTFMTMHLMILLLKEFTLRRDPQVHEWLFEVMEAIEKNQIRSLPDLHDLLVSQLGTKSLIFLDEKSLQSYNLDLIRPYLTKQSEINLNSLRKESFHEAAQQLLYLLETHEMKQIFVITQSPMLLVLTNTPLIKGAVAYKREVKILKAIIRLLQRKEHHG